MKQFLVNLFFLIVFNCIHTQTQPRLVLPVGHTSYVSSAVFSPDGKLALTASADNTARVYEVASGKELLVLVGHTKSIFYAVFSPDGKLALTASADNTSRIYEVATGKELQTLRGHFEGINSAIFSYDGKLALTASSDNTARVFEVATGKELQVLIGHTKGIISAVFSPDNKLALTASDDNTARVYEVATGKELHVLSGHIKGLRSAVFSPDGKLALTASDDSTAQVYEVATGKKLQVLIGHKNILYSAVFSPDGRLALTASGDSSARVYEVSTGKELKVFNGHTEWISSAVFSPDGKHVLTASDSTARIYDVVTCKELQVLRGHTSYVSSAVFSPDGKKVLTASADNTARVYDIATGKELQVLSGCTISLSSSVFSPDGKLTITAFGDNIARVFELSTGKDLQVFSGQVDWKNSHVFSPDGKLVITASADNTARINELATGKELQTLRGHLDGINSAIFSHDGKLALTASEDHTARVYEVLTGKAIQVLSGHKGRVRSAIFSPDGKLALTASVDNTARVYEVSTGKELKVFNGHTDWISSAVFSPDGKLALTASYDKTARIFEVATGKELHGLSSHTKGIRFAVFSPDGKLALTASYDSTAQVYEVATGKQLHVFSGHKGKLSSAVFSPDGKLALTASMDNTARVFEVATGKELKVLNGHTNWIRSAVFSPDGNLVLTTSFDHLSILWDVGTGKALYTRIQLEGDNWLVYDQDYRFDGTEGAIDYLYLTCGLEVIDLSQVKDSLWVPGLAEKIMNGEDILMNDHPAPKLNELNICELTPLIDELENGDKGLFRYRITPRKGGLGETEVYINGNLTYVFKPEQLEKKREKNLDIYYLSIFTDSLQDFLTGEKGAINPIVVKSKVKGSGIYSRGTTSKIIIQTNEEKPKFYGLFIGVNDYGNPTKEVSELRYKNLDFAAKDANDLAHAVEATARNLFKDDCHIYKLTGIGTSENIPSRENIQKALKEIGEKARASDILYIFFAGHGDIPDKAGEKEIRFILHKADKKNLKTTSFGVDELSEWCHPKNIKAQKRVFVFDACHSGQIINQTMAFNGRGDDDDDARIRQLDKLKDKNGMMILAASADDEFAYEDETLGQGVLTYHLLQAIKEAGDTTLLVRQWFDEAIKGVIEYSRANGNKQEPNSFGDGRFEIGNITEQVRSIIDISCPKTRIGLCEFMSFGSTEEEYPTLKNELSNILKISSVRGDFVYSKNIDKAYRISGVFTLEKNKLFVQYEIKKGDQILATIKLPVFKKNTSEKEIIETVSKSIQSEIERIEILTDKCKQKNK